MLRYITAIPLIMHGLANIAGFFASWTKGSYGFADRPWILSAGVTVKSTPGHVFGLLWLLTTIGLAAAGGGAITQQPWWRWVAVGAASLSLVVIILWWQTVPPGARFGAFFDLAVILALAPPWGATLVQRLSGV